MSSWICPGCNVQYYGLTRLHVCSQCNPDAAVRGVREFTAQATHHDWPEDWDDKDRGRYENRCLYCQHTFIGYKRRASCKLCASPSTKEQHNDD